MICNLVSLQGHVDADIDGYVVIMEIGTVQECDLLSECEMCCLWVDWTSWTKIFRGDLWAHVHLVPTHVKLYLMS